MKIRWVMPQIVAAVHEMALSEHGGLRGVRDKGLLESALARPKNLHEYKKKASLFQLAAAYAFGIAKNHPFVDGNKRVAFVVTVVFLELNGWTLIADEAECVVIFENLASGDLTEKELSAWIKSKSRQSV
ncbi:MAG TPA: type II toxin-antitoxin system death-on-curing family toxin [Methylomicrobium sp.]|nr:type II toxin-antitoxin system death-on-curing family toxin [Methylomicrobium sp.]